MVRLHASYVLRPHLEKMLFPHQQRGVYITAGWELFFSILPNKNVLVKISSFSYPPPPPPQKGGGGVKILRPPGWPQFQPPAGQETNFFLRVALRSSYIQIDDVSYCNPLLAYDTIWDGACFALFEGWDLSN